MADAQNDNRGRLRTAHQMRAAAEVKLTEAQAAEKRGAELVRGAEAEVAALDAKAHEIVETQAERIRDEIQGGKPAGRIGVRGEADRTARRATAASRLASARKAHGLLAGEVEVAASGVARAKAAISTAIETLLMGEATRLAAEAEAAEVLARDLRRELGGLARVWVSDMEGGRPRAIRLPPPAVKLLGSRPRNHPDLQLPGGFDPIAAPLAKWREVAEKLKADPEAPMPAAEE